MAAEPKSFLLSAPIAEYILTHSDPVDGVQRWLIDETRRRTGDAARMQVSPEQGRFMTMLTRAVGARRALEVGTFTGYSGLCLAYGLGVGGRLVTCDVSDEWTAVAREAWDRAGVADRVDLRLGHAIETLRALPPDAAFDLAFVDADKESYEAYFEEIVGRLRPNGIMLVDNTLWSGTVLDDVSTEVDLVAIRAFNDMVVADERVDTVLLPISDGLTFLRKR